MKLKKYYEFNYLPQKNYTITVFTSLYDLKSTSLLSGVDSLN